MKKVRFGIIGGGLMGRELASALARWFVLSEMPVQAELVAVCDLGQPQREWFRRVPTVRLVTADYNELLASPDVDVVYVAVPHHLHEKIYVDVLDAGKDLLAEKPFGIDLPSAESILAAVARTGRFARCSSEFPFFPGAQRVFRYVREGRLGTPVEFHSGFWHSSDLDPSKPINWKRQQQFCGEIGVMGDLGLHVAHLPLRLGLKPVSIFAQLQNIYKERPDGKGGIAPCDTWDNALLHAATVDGVPIRFEMKRMAPGEMNTWFFEALGTDGGVRFSTKDPKALYFFTRGKEQEWTRLDVGYQSVFPTITGPIFEHGFPDCFLQMIAAYVAEREGVLGDRFGCATPEEAVESHRLFAASLESHDNQRVVSL